MASPIKSNDDSSLTTTTTAAVSSTEPATIATTAKNLAIDTASETAIKVNGITSTIDEKNPQTQSVSDSPIIKNGGDDVEGELQNSSTDPTDSGGGGISIKLSDSSAATTPGNTTTATSTSSNVSPQTPTSAPRSKPLEKPKPLKLADNIHQQFPMHYTSQSQILYHPAASGAFALGASSVLGAIPHSIFVGGGHLPHQQPGGGLSHHIQSAMQQHGQSQQGANHPGGDGMAAVSTDEILETMEQINRSVKAGQFSTTLAGHIFRLYGYLKHVGELLEQSHKNEMNRVFVSLRQACCRDSGQLGTPCRLKIMELVELRAMGWRPNLAHSQYYLNRGGGSLTNGFNGNMAMGGEFNPLSVNDAMSGGDMEQLGAAPVSAPPFGTFPMNPFAFNLPPTSLAGGGGPHVTAAELVSTAAAAAAASMAPHAPSYYLIPASHVGHTQAGIAFISPTAAATVLPPPPMSPLAHSAAAAAAAAHHQQQQRLHMPVAASLSHPTLTGVGINPSTSPTLQSAGNSGLFLKGAVTKTSGKYSRPAKIPGKSQYRDEVVIRNADSGKIMGVKGRRVAIIEELSKTIISFQKVPQGAKERTLTITGPTEESIEQAKMLIEETIRRNVSPVRGEGEGDVGDLYRGASLITACMEDDGDENGNGANDDDLSEDGEDGKERAAAEGGGGDGKEFTIEAGQVGEMLKLQCSDPALLEAAKQALSAYFRGQKQTQGHSALRRTTTDAAARDQARKERRKSMPTLDNQRLLALKQSSPPKNANQPSGTDDSHSNVDGEQETQAAEGGKSNKPLTLTMLISPPIGKQKASSAARSTPNLAATGLNKRALCMMKSMDTNGKNASEDPAVETKFMADESGGGTLVIHENKSRVTVRVVYTREFVLQCAASPFANLTPSGLPWISRESPDILRPVPGKFDVNDYKHMCVELRQQQHQ